MKYINIKRLTLLLIAFGIIGFANAQVIKGYRYWFDSNIASATAVNVTAAPNFNLTAALAAGAHGNGYHTITMQFVDSNGIYSVPITNTFVSTGYNISAYEYWWDANYAGHTLVTVTPTQTIDLTAAIVPYALDTGMHLFAIRFKDMQGNWSVPLQDTVHTTVYIAGIREITSLSNISISPNPTHANAMLTFDGSGDEVLTLTVTDISGKQISREELQNGFVHQQYQINTLDLAAGVYLVKIASGKGSAIRKLVVQ